MLSGFRNFILRGNVVDLAVGVIIGAAFGGVVDAFTKGIIDPLLAMITGGQKDIAMMVGPFNIGLLISALINFVIKAAVIYFGVVMPFGSFAAKMAAATPPPPSEQLLTEIRDLLKK